MTYYYSTKVKKIPFCIKPSMDESSTIEETLDMDVPTPCKEAHQEMQNFNIVLSNWLKCQHLLISSNCVMLTQGDMAFSI